MTKCKKRKELNTAKNTFIVIIRVMVYNRWVTLQLKRM